jgi:hypothetical protein
MFQTGVVSNYVSSGPWQLLFFHGSMVSKLYPWRTHHHHVKKKKNPRQTRSRAPK